MKNYADRLILRFIRLKKDLDMVKYILPMVKYMLPMVKQMFPKPFFRHTNLRRNLSAEFSATNLMVTSVLMQLFENLVKMTKNNHFRRIVFFWEIFNFFESLQIASNRSESLPDGSEWIRMYPNDLWQLKNPEKSGENNQKTRKQFQQFANKSTKQSFLFVNIRLIPIS